MSRELVYLDTYILQQDMRIRLPKSILTNLSAKKGKTRFEIYLNNQNNELILKVADDSVGVRKNETNNRD